MSIRSTLVNTGDKNSIDAARTMVHELRRIKSSLTNIATSGLQSTMVSLLTNIDTNINSLLTSTELSNWETIVGNSKEFTYYAGVEPGNPSGTITNIKTIIYKQGVTTIITQTIAYNAADLVISIITT
jgi:NADH:ubiquinone oxidoreductase subunit D